MRTVVIYGRDGCCLCEQALELLERVRATRPFVLEQCDIESDERLLTAYLERIPVITIDGVEVFEFFVDESELQRRLDEPAPDPARDGR
ncbi:MAG TPA: glutaredoxin family protein [Solirubrobacteraceae bacterium]|jgi:glutaredoxin|nr:glutaredoxin family protein [Solirubrobacteraceae bacterium]